MHSVIIVDDEKNIRESFASLIDWESMGFSVSAILPDGQDAIDYIQNNPVHLVLTDIKMNNKTGLDLAKYVCENKVKSKIIIISGFKDFEFAQQAIQYGVQAYLLKPTNFKELIKHIHQIKEELDQEILKDRHSNVSDVKDMITKDMFFLSIIFEGERNTEVIKKRCRAFDIDDAILDHNCCFFSIHLIHESDFYKENWKYGKDAFRQAIRRMLIDESEKNLYEMVNASENKFEVLIFDRTEKGEDSFNNRAQDFIEYIKKEITGLFGSIIEISEVCYFGNMYEYIDTFYNDSSNNQYLGESKKLLITHISEGNTDIAYQMVGNIIEQFHESDLELAKRFFCDFLQAFTEENASNYLMRLNDSRSLTEVSSCMKEFISTQINDVWKDSGEVCKKIIAKAENYIYNNYANDISLDDVANQLYLNSFYFSRLFKKYTGVNYIDFLTAYRLKKSEELLKVTDLKIYEICNKVGYKSIKYFNKLFKNNMGYTPTQYRNKYKVMN